MAKKILLIEYEPRYLDRIRGHLAGKDFDLVVAKDGEEGLEAYKRGRPDLVLVSSVLPKLRTPDVIKGMQGMGGTPPILLMMSGYKGKNKRADAQRVGATSILEKPFSEEVFLEEIGAALGGKSAPANDPFPADGQTGAGLLSADDIFSDVLSGMEDESRPVATVNQGTDPGIQKKLEQTLSGILPAPRRSSSGTTGSIPKADPPRPPAPAPAPRPPAPAAPTPPVRPAEPMDGGDRTVRLDLTGAGGPAVIPPPPSAVRDSSTSIANKAAVSTSVDKMLTDTLSGLKVRPATGAAPKPDTGPIPRPVVTPAAPARDKTPPPTEKLARPAEPVRAEPPAPPAPRPAPKPAPEPPRETFRPPEPPRREEKRRETTTSVPMATGPGAFGRYQLLEKIAAGGMAEVYKARMKGEEGFEKIVAIKRILPHMADNDDFITMFVDEAKLAAQLTHNNIIHIYDLGRVDAYHYIAMEYVEGKDLRSILKMGQERGYPLPPELALFIASKIGNALEYAHRRVGMDGKELNLVHRDVSPQNILISFEGDIKLCDFGIAKAATKVSQTQTGALKGKLQYMSPEQAWGKKIDRRTDIFSLGIVLFEMLTGERLFTGDTDLTILEQVRDAKVVAPSTKNYELPKKVDQVVLKALAKNPQDRYQNANEFEKDINSILYSYQPTPGPADLAIYMHRLLESQPAVSDEQIDAAFAMADTGGPLVEEKKKGKGLVISKKEKPKAAPAPEPVVPAVTEVSQPALSMGREEPKSRMGLYVGIGVGVVALGAAGFFLTRGSGTKPPEAQPTPAPVAATSPSTAPAEVPTPAATVAPQLDKEALAKEIARQKAELEAAARAAAAAGKPTPATAPAVPVPAGRPTPATSAPSLAPSREALPPQVATPTPAPVAATPTPAPVRVAEAPKPTEPPAPPPVPAQPIQAQAAPAQTEEVKRGDMVGLGPGVVPPKFSRLAPFTSLPPQVRSTVKNLNPVRIMALVTETGAVSETKVLSSSGNSFVDEAAVSAVKNTKFEAPTKNGIPVKMWFTLPPVKVQ